MVNKRIIIGLGIISLAGCATARRPADVELQNLHTQINQLQTQIQDKDNQITSLQESLDKESKERAALATQLGSLSQKYKPVTYAASIKQIQIALQNAGYDPGKIDGAMGAKTRQAVKDFQKANALKVTAKVDKETWLLLRQYLHKKVK